MVDDILDCTQDTATLGKTAGKDEKDDKPTWVSLLGLDGARERAARMEAEALEGLALVESDAAMTPDRLEGVRRLREIAAYVIHRTH